MKKILITLLMAMPLLAAAQDNTWERIETATAESTNPDAKYLAENAVPMVDGKVCWKTTINAPGKSAQQVYDILQTQLNKMVKEENQLFERSKVAIQDQAKHQLGATFHEWLVFKNTALSLDRTVLNFQLIVDCSDGKADVQITRVSYDYELERDPTHYTAEEWISDKYAVNKKRTKLLKLSAKFRRKTIDRKDFIFNKFTALLNEK
jgi:colicin import membrane protein